MPVPKLTSAEWQDVRRRAIVRGLELTRSPTKARDLADWAIAKALEPDTTPWDPAKQPKFADYICDLVWSQYGHETTSYRVTHASFSLEEGEAEAAPDSSTPEALTLRADEAERARRRRVKLAKLVAGEPLIVLLVRAAEDDEEDEGVPPRPNAEPLSTRRALEAGYTLMDIKNARRRLKRLAEAVAREEEDEEEES